MKRRHIIHPLIAMLALTTGCEFWDEVTIPAEDDSPPIGVARLYEVGGEELDVFAYGSGQDIIYETSNLHRTFVPIAAAWDAQGAKTVRMYQGATRYCVDEDIHVGTNQNIHMFPLEAHQTGDTGDTVDTGVWVSSAVTMSQAANCPGTTELVSYTYWWVVEAENFFGQTVTGPRGSITFRP